MTNKKSIRITVGSCLLIVSMVAGLFVYSTISPKELTAEEYKQIGFYKLVRTRQINDFELLIGSEKFTNESLKGSWDVLFLGFASCPDMCPMTMKKMAMAASKLTPEISSRVNFRMISVDPDRDTPNKMQRYAKAFNENFSGIAGDIEIIYKLATDLTLPFVPVLGSDVTNYDMDHSMNLALIDPDGNYFGFFKSPHSPDKLSEVLTSVVSYN